jgi:hypothetical protein
MSPNWRLKYLIFLACLEWIGASVSVIFGRLEGALVLALLSIGAALIAIAVSLIYRNPK